MQSPSSALLATLFAQLVDCEFEPAASRAILQRAAARHGLEDCFDLDALQHGGHFARDRLLFGASDLQRWAFTAQTDETWVRCETDAAGAEQLGQLIYAWARGEEEFVTAWRDAFPDTPVPGFEPPRDVARWPRAEGPCIVRREHASLLIDSGTTRVLLDPQGLESGWTTNDGRYPAEDGPLAADAICLTHSHSDHFALASMIAHCREDTRVIVPRVERANLLCPDVRRAAQIVGLDVEDPPWGEVVTVGDISIEVLPFYGEQPTRSLRTTPAGVRNWGNCYRFQTPTFSAIALVDSGVDPSGSVHASLRRSVERFGPTDVVLSCCAGFPEIINAGLRNYIFTQPFALLRQTHLARKHGAARLPITFGPSGVARACESAAATYFAPYAHGFEGLGVHPRDERWMVEHLEPQLQGTAMLRWAPGDIMRFEGGSASVTRPTRAGARRRETARPTEERRDSSPR
ncbi:MAG: MBL fold metallo-hydrolase [Myxococcota bacterium]